VGSDGGMKQNIADIVKQIHRLPTLPVVYAQLERLIANPTTSARQLGVIVAEDQALATTILKVVNSAFYGFSQAITSTERAVVLLGFNELKHIALSISVLNYFKNDIETDEFDMRSFWRHSLGVGVCARIIAQKLGPHSGTNPEEAFTAGLIHDIGKLLAHQFMNKLFLEAIRICSWQKITISDAEKITLGFTHALLGEALLVHWKLPPVLARAVRYHNSPQIYTNGIAFSLVSLIHVADVFVRALEIGSGGDPFIPRLCIAAWHRLGLKPSHIKPILQETEKAYREMSGIMTLF